MLIKVTQEHINAGRSQETGFCPVAIAIKEALGLPRVHKNKVLIYSYFPDKSVFESVEVYQSPIYVTLNGILRTKENNIEVRLYPCPPEVAEFIKQFNSDSMLILQPFEFELDIK